MSYILFTKCLQDKQKKNVKGKVEKVHGYERDNLEIEIMLGQRAYIGTLACTSTEPLKVLTSVQFDFVANLAGLTDCIQFAFCCVLVDA